MFLYKICAAMIITEVIAYQSTSVAIPIGLHAFLIISAIISGVLAIKFKSPLSTKSSNKKTNHQMYNCPNCGRLNHSPGNCSGPCDPEPRGVFKM